jgi:hypothetical protein
VSYSKGYDRTSEYTKWAASRPGVPDNPSDRRRFRNPLGRPVLTLVTMLAFVSVIGGGAYVLFGTTGPPVSADHDAVVETVDLAGTICCITHHTIDDRELLLVPLLEPRGFFSDQRELSLRILEREGDDLIQIASLDAPIPSTLPQSMTVIGSNAYVPLSGQTDDAGIWILDISDPANPDEIARWSAGEPITSLEKIDDRTLIGRGSGIFQFFDISQPEAPEIIADSRQPVGSVQRMEMQHERLYYRGSGADHIAIADVSDLTAMQPLGRHLNTERLSRTPMRHSSVIGSAEERLEVTAPSRHYPDFAVMDDVLYVAASDLGVEIVDISDPTAPDTIDRIETSGRAVRTAIAGDVLYVVTVDEESRDRLAYAIHSFDLRDLIAPELGTTVDGIRAAPGRQAIETSGSHLFLGLNDTVVMIKAEH